MEVLCKHCGKTNSIPDSAVSNKKIFFYCPSCGEKVVVDGRKPCSEREQSAGKKKLTIMDIFSALRNTFIAFNFTITIFYLLIAFFTLLLSGFIFYKKLQFFMTHIPVSAAFIAIIAGFLYFGYCLLIYFISRTISYRKSHPTEKKIDLRHLFFDFRDDFFTLILSSVGFTVIFAILLVPIILFKSGGLLASSFLIPVLSVLAIAIILSAVLMNYICAYIAIQSNFFIESIKSTASFLFNEMLNIPAFSFVISVSVTLIYTILSAIISLGIFAAFGTSYLLMNASAKENIIPFISNLMIKIQGLETAKAAIPVHASLGMIIILIFVFVIILFMKSLFINLMQSFYTEAVFIMKSNPGNSVHKAGVFATFLVIFGGIGIIVLTYSFMIMQFAGKLSPLMGK